MNLKTLVLAALIVVVATVVALRFWPSDQRAIRKQLALIETLGSKEAAEKPLDSLLHARQLADLFTDPCTLQVESADFTGQYPRKQLQERIAMLRSCYTHVQVSLHDLTTEIPDRNTQKATIRCTLRIKGEGNNRAVADVQELTAEMHKIEGEWLFASITLVEVLER